MNSPEVLTYYPGVFDVPTIEAAKAIILTPEDAASSEDRWVTETPYLAERLGTDLNLTEGSLVLDYGCGIGRLAKALIDEYGCTVIGVDISPSMRALAHAYVASDRFIPVSVRGFARMVENGVRVDGAYAVWVLQHCLQVEDDINVIYHALKQFGFLAVVNDRTRIVPTVEKRWVNDGLDVRALLAQRFREISMEDITSDKFTKTVAECSFIGVYRREVA